MNQETNEKDKRQITVYDLETYPNFFSFSGLEVHNTNIKPVFYVFEEINQISEMVAYCNSIEGLIGYNNINFDYPILDRIIKKSKRLAALPGDVVNRWIFYVMKSVIRDEYSAIDRPLIPQLDLYKIHHFDNQAKRTSLKDLEIHMNWKRVQDLPFHYTHHVRREEVQTILDYNMNDVLATYEFYKKSEAQIELRKSLSKRYGMNFMNHSNTKIGSDLLLKLYCEKTRKPIQSVRKLRTYRPQIQLGEIIFDYISFKSNTFQSFLRKLQEQVITKTKGSFEYSVPYKGFVYDYGLGGIHGSIKSGIYEHDEDHLIIDADVSSLYPSIAIVNKLYPRHLGKEFCDVYDKDIVSVRLAEKAKKDQDGKTIGDKAIIDGFKEAANASYGNSNSEYSWLYDPKYTMTTTINGQLMLTMLAEELVDTIPDLLMIQINTDGLTVKIHKKYESLYYDICNRWQKLTMLQLEYVYYSKMIIRDVNNYMALPLKGKPKYKGGAFVTEREFHKNPSDKIITIALSEYFLHNIPIEQTIRNHPNIFDFCSRFKATQGWHSEIRYLSKDENGNAIENRDKLQKTNRYYISNDGATYLKIHQDGREHAIQKGYLVTIFNDYIEMDMSQYNINYQYYIHEANKILNTIENKQLSLF